MVWSRVPQDTVLNPGKLTTLKWVTGMGRSLSLLLSLHFSPQCLNCSPITYIYAKVEPALRYEALML